MLVVALVVARLGSKVIRRILERVADQCRARVRAPRGSGPGCRPCRPLPPTCGASSSSSSPVAIVLGMLGINLDPAAGQRHHHRRHHGLRCPADRARLLLRVPAHDGGPVQRRRLRHGRCRHRRGRGRHHCASRASAAWTARSTSFPTATSANWRTFARLGAGRGRPDPARGHRPPISTRPCRHRGGGARVARLRPVRRSRHRAAGRWSA